MSSSTEHRDRKANQAIQLAGLFLWRFGLMLASATALYRTSKLLLQFIELPTQLEIGIGLLMTGFVFLIASLVMERLVDARSEGDLGG